MEQEQVELNVSVRVRVELVMTPDGPRIARCDIIGCLLMDDAPAAAERSAALH